MAKAKAQTEPKEPKTHRSPLSAFARHQLDALEEAGRAVASLLPDRFREHAGNALHESKQGWEALADGVIDVVEDGLDRLRSTPKEAESSKDKVKVDVD
jgi:hypothetical protein